MQNWGFAARAALRVLTSCLFLATMLAPAHAFAGTNTAPQISGTPSASATVGQTYLFRPSVYDADGDRLRFTIANKPGWAAFNARTGRLSGTPTSANVGTYSNIRISVSDRRATTSLAAFSIEIANSTTPVNRAPVISGTPPTSVPAGQAYSFKPSASDPDGNMLGFSIQNRPGWASFNTTTGALTGTPAATQAGSYAGIVIAVSDGSASSALQSFTITVSAPTNTAPTISGTPPASVTAGSPYSFRPTATDADGGALVFSISNKPAWASFDSRSGLLAGTPGTSDVGTYQSVTISVSDGTASVALPAFSIAVNQIAVGNVSLTWTPPTQNTDGSALTNLAGYRLYYGTNSATLTQIIQITDAGASAYFMQNLAPGTWYFSVRSVSNSGQESANSNIVTKTVQ